MLSLTKGIIKMTYRYLTVTPVSNIVNYTLINKDLVKLCTYGENESIGVITETDVCNNIINKCVSSLDNSDIIVIEGVENYVLDNVVY